jgi:copper chaperone CopZ
MSYLVHNVPGRIRIKIPAVKYRPLLEKEIKQNVLNLYGVDRMHVNTVTGSITINYDPEVINTEQLLNVLKFHQYIDPTKSVVFEKPVNGAATKAGAAIGKAVLSWTVSRALEANGLSFLAAFV